LPAGLELLRGDCPGLQGGMDFLINDPKRIASIASRDWADVNV